MAPKDLTGSMAMIDSLFPKVSKVTLASDPSPVGVNEDGRRSSKTFVEHLYTLDALLLRMVFLKVHYEKDWITVVRGFLAEARQSRVQQPRHEREALYLKLSLGFESVKRYNGYMNRKLHEYEQGKLGDNHDGGWATTWKYLCDSRKQVGPDGVAADCSKLLTKLVDPTGHTQQTLYQLVQFQDTGTLLDISKLLRLMASWASRIIAEIAGTSILDDITAKTPRSQNAAAVPSPPSSQPAETAPPQLKSHSNPPRSNTSEKTDSSIPSGQRVMPPPRRSRSSLSILEATRPRSPLRPAVTAKATTVSHLAKSPSIASKAVNRTDNTTELVYSTAQRERSTEARPPAPEGDYNVEALDKPLTPPLSMPDRPATRIVNGEEEMPHPPLFRAHTATSMLAVEAETEVSQPTIPKDHPSRRQLIGCTIAMFRQYTAGCQKNDGLVPLLFGQTAGCVDPESENDGYVLNKSPSFANQCAIYSSESASQATRDVLPMDAHDPGPFVFSEVFDVDYAATFSNVHALAADILHGSVNMVRKQNENQGRRLHSRSSMLRLHGKLSVSPWICAPFGAMALVKLLDGELPPAVHPPAHTSHVKDACPSDRDLLVTSKSLIIAVAPVDCRSKDPATPDLRMPNSRKTLHYLIYPGDVFQVPPGFAYRTYAVLACGVMYRGVLCHPLKPCLRAWCRQARRRAVVDKLSADERDDDKALFDAITSDTDMKGCEGVIQALTLALRK